jgi:hypothetical protein
MALGWIGSTIAFGAVRARKTKAYLGNEASGLCRSPKYPLDFPLGLLNSRNQR